AGAFHCEGLGCVTVRIGPLGSFGLRRIPLGGFTPGLPRRLLGGGGVLGPFSLRIACVGLLLCFRQRGGFLIGSRGMGWSFSGGFVLLRCRLGGHPHARRLQVCAGFGLGDLCGGHRLLGRCHIPLGSVGLHPV